MPPMGGMMPPPGMGPGMAPPGMMDPMDPLMNPNADPGLGPMTNGGPEPDQATLEQLIAMLQMMGVGGAASGMPVGPGGMGIPAPGGASPEIASGGAAPMGAPAGRPGMMVPPGGGPGAPNPLMAALAARGGM